MPFVKGQRIRVNSPEYADHGATGYVAIVDHEQNCYWCWLDEWRFPLALDESELQPEEE